MHRLFAAIRPPQAIRDLLVDVMDEAPELRWVDEEQLHLTLRFIGEVDRPLANDIAAALGTVRAPAFDLSIKGVGRFDRRGGGAVWAGVEPKAPLAALAAKVERACQGAGLEPERRAYHPHLTLARWNGPSSRAAGLLAERARGLSSPAFGVDRFTLFESHLSRHGPHYETVADYRLRAAADELSNRPTDTTSSEAR